MFEFQISIDLGHSHPGSPPLLLLWSFALEERCKAGWGGAVFGGLRGTRASTCVLFMLQRMIRREEEGRQQPLEL